LIEHGAFCQHPRENKALNLSEITVVVPVWQCAERIQKHFEVVRRLSAAGCPTIWVCSWSEDGSHQLAKEESERIGGHYLLTPRGLYDSWNKGIQESRTPYTYISTVGESILPEGLAHLWDLIRKVEADFVFSPPTLPQNIKARRQILQWPVFVHAQKLKIFDHRVVPTNLVASIQSASGISCLLGSFSSCLCRTSFMQGHAFPTRFYHYGDTAWFSMNLNRCRVAYSVRAVADFQFHDAPQRRINPDHRQIFLRWIARNTFPKGNFFRFVVLKYCLYIRFLDLKRGTRPKRYWYLNPKVFYIRILRGLCESLMNFRSSFLSYRFRK